MTGLLAGCHLGVARPKVWRHAGWFVPALMLLVLLPVFGEEGPAFLWGGFIALALSVIAFQHALTRPAWLEARALVGLGTVSYGVYLWHYVFLQRYSGVGCPRVRCRCDRSFVVSRREALVGLVGAFRET